ILVPVPANTAAEIADTALSLCTRDIDAICQISDNLTASAFSSIAIQAQKAKIPIFSFSSIQPLSGGTLAIARDYYDGGREAGLLAARVMRGESPAHIPFTNVKTTRLVVNLARARELGIAIPESIINRADEVIE
ncbi:MAG: hypothetical protein JSV03_09445, partial [Planctomycetota bacterium]